MKFFVSISILCLFSYYGFSIGYERSIYNLGLKYYSSGNYEKALESFLEIFNNFPYSQFYPASCMYIGIINYEISNLKNAKKFLKVAMKRSLEGSEVWVNSVNLLATIYYEEGNVEKSKKLFSLVKKRFSNVNITKYVKFGSLTNSSSREGLSERYDRRYNNTNIYVTNVMFITNFVTNIFTNVLNSFSEKVDHLPTLSNVSEKVSTLKKKDEDLEDLNRLVDIKNKLIKLNEKALMIQELLNKNLLDNDNIDVDKDNIDE